MCGTAVRQPPRQSTALGLLLPEMPAAGVYLFRGWPPSSVGAGAKPRAGGWSARPPPHRWKRLLRHPAHRPLYPLKRTWWLPLAAVWRRGPRRRLRAPRGRVEGATRTSFGDFFKKETKISPRARKPSRCSALSAAGRVRRSCQSTDELTLCAPTSLRAGMRHPTGAGRPRRLATGSAPTASGGRQPVRGRRATRRSGRWTRLCPATNRRGSCGSLRSTCWG